jgi:hypothetical protein
MADTAAPQSTPVGAQLPSASIAKRPIVWVSVGAAVAIAGGVTIWTLARSTTRAKADTDGVIAVVDRRDEPTDSAAPRVDAGTAAVVAPPDAPPRSHTPPGHTKRDPNETDTAQLTRTFGHQTPAVQACFRDHPQQVDGVISIRIKIDVAGAVGSAEVLPAGLASTPLGTCLAGVARGTAFGPQPKPATFRVPINVGRRP